MAAAGRTSHNHNYKDDANSLSSTCFLQRCGCSLQRVCACGQKCAVTLHNNKCSIIQFYNNCVVRIITLEVDDIRRVIKRTISLKILTVMDSWFSDLVFCVLVLFPVSALYQLFVCFVSSPVPSLARSCRILCSASRCSSVFLLK